jgi:hypothetical protein
MRTAAFQSTRALVWPRIGQAYLDLAIQVVSDTPVKPRRRATPQASSLPELRLDHLFRLTDDTGVIQHATYNVPNRKSGYCVDDNARALLVAVDADRLSSTFETRRLMTTCLAYLHHAQTDDGGFTNFMGYDRTFDAAGGSSQDCVGRAVWALGSAAAWANDEGHRMVARGMLEQAMRRMSELGLRGTASAILGMCALLEVEPHATARDTVFRLANQLVERFNAHAQDGWRWFESTLTYDNALMPLALFKAHSVTGERTHLRIARESLEFLEEVCFRGPQLALVGNAGWHRLGGEKPVADEQGIDAAAFVLAFRGAYLVTKDHHYLRRMRAAFAWFLGDNRLGIPLYDTATAGCRDGLGASSANQNQGAESTISFLLSLFQMLELAGEGLEYASASVVA